MLVLIVRLALGWFELNLEVIERQVRTDVGYKASMGGHAECGPSNIRRAELF